MFLAKASQPGYFHGRSAAAAALAAAGAGTRMIAARSGHDSARRNARLTEQPLVDAVGLIEGGITLCTVTVEAEIRIVVHELAEYGVAVGGIGLGVEDVEMPEIVDETVRHRGELREAQADLEEAAIPLLAFVCSRTVPALAFGGRFHEFALDLHEIKVLDGPEAGSDASVLIHGLVVCLTMN